MKLFAAILLSLIFLLSLPIAAVAKPIEVISENFEFYGDASEKAAEDLIRNLEAYRAIIFKIYGLNTGPEYIPVKIYGFKSQSRIEKLTGHDNIGGLYSTTLEGPVFLLSTDGGFRGNKPAYRTAYHEYTHHILASFTDKYYPRWYNEGYAEYLSTFEYREKKREFKIGLPNNGRSWALANIKWMPSDVILKSIRRYPFKRSGGRGNSMAQSIFYAQSWLATHYILSKPEYAKKFGKYVEALNEFDVPEDAFEKAMGISIEDFEKELKKYYKANRYNYMTVTLGDDVEIPTVKTRRISKAELKYHYGEVMRRMFSSQKSKELAHEFFNEAAEELGQTTDILASKALLAINSEDYDNAKKFAQAALAQSPNSRRVHSIMGYIELTLYQKFGNEKGSITAARKHLIRAMKAYPDDVTSHYFYAQSFLDGNDKPSKQAIASAQSALNYYRSLNFMESNLIMARVLEKGGKADLAKPVYKRILVWSQTPSMRSFARKKLKQLEK